MSALSPRRTVVLQALDFPFFGSTGNRRQRSVKQRSGRLQILFSTGLRWTGSARMDEDNGCLGSSVGVRYMFDIRGAMSFSQQPLFFRMQTARLHATVDHVILVG